MSEGKRKSMKCDSFIFYASFFEAIRELPDENQLALYNAIFEYGLNGVEPNLTGINKTVFTLIAPQLKANRTRYENGCKGGAPVGNSNARKQPKNNRDITEGEKEKQPKNNPKQPNENVNENENENDNEREKGAPVREPPTLEEVKAFVEARKLEHVDAERFYNWFSAAGWYRGKTRIVNWQAEAINWERSGIADVKRQAVPAKRCQDKPYSSKNFDEREYSNGVAAGVSIDELEDDDL